MMALLGSTRPPTCVATANSSDSVRGPESNQRARGTLSSPEGERQVASSISTLQPTTSSHSCKHTQRSKQLLTAGRVERQAAHSRGRASGGRSSRRNVRERREREAEGLRGAEKHQFKTHLVGTHSCPPGGSSGRRQDLRPRRAGRKSAIMMVVQRSVQCAVVPVCAREMVGNSYRY
jgi:hypothetical protein